MNEPVGVLVIGAGASGAAFAWRIADIGTSVLCLEQGPWMRQQDYPSNGLDWEAQGMGEYSPSPNVRSLRIRRTGTLAFASSRARAPHAAP